MARLTPWFGNEAVAETPAPFAPQGEPLMTFYGLDTPPTSYGGYGARRAARATRGTQFPRSADPSSSIGPFLLVTGLQHTTSANHRAAVLRSLCVP